MLMDFYLIVVSFAKNNLLCEFHCKAKENSAYKEPVLQYVI